jgi:hypothetical protein
MDQTKLFLAQNYQEMDRVTISTYGGAVAGAPRLFLMVPLELLKTRAQNTKNGDIRYSKMISTLYKQ